MGPGEAEVSVGPEPTLASADGLPAWPLEGFGRDKASKMARGWEPFLLEMQMASVEESF